MARTGRVRSRVIPFDGGRSRRYKNGVLTATLTPTRTYTALCIDSRGRPIVDSPFTSYQREGTYPSMTGFVEPTVGLPDDRAEYENFSPNDVPSQLTNLSATPAPNGWMLDLVAGTNPSRPVLNIPEAIENLVQLPGMIRGLGNLMKNAGKPGKPRWLASEYLGIQFGWAPLIEDLLKLLDLQKYVIKRNAELAKLYSGKGLRRRLKFGSDTTVETQLQQTAVGNSTVSMVCTILIHKRQWGVIKWYPLTPPQYHPDDESRNAYARKLVLGATPEALALGLWKVIPWTWLLGWFTNFGKYTLAHSWTVPARHGTGCYMSMAQAALVPGPVKVTNASNFAVANGGKLIQTVRTRSVASAVTVGFNMPYLDMFRLSILTALFVQRFAGKPPP